MAFPTGAIHRPSDAWVWDVDTMAWVKMVQPGTGTVTVDGPVDVLSGLAVPEHDYIALSYTGDNLTGVVFKTGGSGGSTVATLTLAYTGDVLDSVTKS